MSEESKRELRRVGLNCETTKLRGQFVYVVRASKRYPERVVVREPKSGDSYLIDAGDIGET